MDNSLPLHTAAETAAETARAQEARWPIVRGVAPRGELELDELQQAEAGHGVEARSDRGIKVMHLAAGADLAAATTALPFVGKEGVAMLTAAERRPRAARTRSVAQAARRQEGIVRRAQGSTRRSEGAEQGTQTAFQLSGGSGAAGLRLRTAQEEDGGDQPAGHLASLTRAVYGLTVSGVGRCTTIAQRLEALGFVVAPNDAPLLSLSASEGHGLTGVEGCDFTIKVCLHLFFINRAEKSDPKVYDQGFLTLTALERDGNNSDGFEDLDGFKDLSR